MTSSSPNTPEYSVSELALALKRTVEDAFGYVRLRGEISGLKVAASGHAYLCLKDDKAVIDGVMWKGGVQALRFRPEDGLEVIVTGKLTTYPGRSKYQIVIERMEPAGVGALMALLEQRRAKLAAEGLFDPARKRPLPFLPQVIGVVTSPTGAVIRDILHRLADRFPRRVILWPVLVQGEGAAAQVAAAVRGFNSFTGEGTMPRPDLLIVARGGGSIEDLWAFNEEIVVRAVAESAIPVISAVGHETDTTLVDFAADRRAPTPTAAAEMAVPVLADLNYTVGDLALRLERAWAKGLSARGDRLQAAACRLPSARELLALSQQRCDDLADRLPRALRTAAQLWRGRYDRVGVMLRPALLDRRYKQAKENVDRQVHALTCAGRDKLARQRQRLEVQACRLRPYVLETVARSARQRFEQADRLLESLSPLATLKRGYAVVERRGGGVVTSSAEAEAAVRLTISFGDGRVDVTTDTSASASRSRTRPAPEPTEPKQGVLL